tara:strand:+ start:1878 stop:2702 length:825 start_codon:yes stop_codon:yes gene_type:complete
MKKKNQLLIYCFTFCLLSNCSSNDDSPTIPTGQTKQYNLTNTELSDLTGQVNFIENTNGSTTISVILNNTVKGINNVVRLRRNTANIGGGIFLNLNNINGDNGTSITTVSKLTDGTKITYDQFADLNGYFAIEGTGDSEGVLYAFTDLGPNEFTGKKITYDLFSPNGDINGLAQFEERKKGSAALMVGLFDLGAEDELLCSLHIIQENTSEEIIHILSPIRSRLKGFGFTELSDINGQSLNYEDILKLDAFINVKTSNDNLISEGGVGINIDYN